MKNSEIMEYIKKICNNNKSLTVEVTMYNEEDYWQEQNTITLTYDKVNSACMVWCRSPHPHKPFTYFLAIVSDYISRPFPTYCIKDIKIIR